MRKKFFACILCLFVAVMPLSTTALANVVDDHSNGEAQTDVAAATITDVSVSGTVGVAIIETEATITPVNTGLIDIDVNDEVSSWFTNLPAGLSVKVKAVGPDYLFVKVAISGMPTEAITAEMTVAIPAANVITEVPLLVTANANAKWAISGNSYDNNPSTVTIYNDPVTPDASIWLTGSGLDSSDLLVTERNPSGSAYQALLELADSNDIFSTYDIHLRSGKKSTGSAMSLTFDLNEAYKGQDFTLVHQKDNGTYEYFYESASASGDLSFGPLYELSPFMLVKGRLEKVTEVAQVPENDLSPKTGDSTLPSLWISAVLALASILLACSVLCKRKID